MSRRHYVNSATVTQTTGALTSGATSVTVTDASSYPASFPYTGQLDAGTASFEVVLVTAAAGSTLTIERGYDGTAAQAHAANATFAPCAAAIDYDEANDHVNATGNVHGIAGDVVGTTDAQELTNKTLTGPTITGADLDAASTLGGISGTDLTDERAAWTDWSVDSFVNITGGAGTFKYKLVGMTLFVRGHFTAGTVTAPGSVGVILATLGDPGSELTIPTQYLGGIAGSKGGWSATGSEFDSQPLSTGVSLAGSGFGGVVEVSL